MSNMSMYFFFFFNDTATTEIYTLSLHDALPIFAARQKIVHGAVSMVDMALKELAEKHVVQLDDERRAAMVSNLMVVLCGEDRKSTRLNSSHLVISYAVFCLKKKKSYNARIRAVV